MDWKNLFLTPSGRIGQKDFWIGILIIFAAGLVLGWIANMINPILGLVVSLALLYPGYCVMAKRFQDFGKNGVIAATPYVISAIVSVMAFVSTAGLIGAAAVGSDAAAMGAAGGLLGTGLLALIGFFVWVAFLLWAGLTKGDPAPNQYGPSPTPAATDMV